MCGTWTECGIPLHAYVGGIEGTPAPDSKAVLTAALRGILWAVVTTGRAWDAAITANGADRIEESIAA